MNNELNITICVIEDNDMYALMLDMKLSEYYNGKVLTYRSAEKFIDDIHNINPQVIILDFFLPGINGYQTLLKIKHFLPYSLVILHSSQKDLNTAINLFKAGAFDYISKEKHSLAKLIKSIDAALKKCLN